MKFSGRVAAIILYSILIFLACTSPQGIRSNHFNISEKEERFEIAGGNYFVIIDKLTAEMRLLNSSGASYTQFPIAAQFESDKSYLDGTSYRWKMKDRTIVLEYVQNEIVFQKVVMEFKINGFEIKFGLFLPAEKKMGIYCGRNGTKGFDDAGWLNYFSPEADTYHKNPPMIDIRADRDNQWVFCPAPLNISIETAAGWFSMGLAKLAPITRFGLDETSVWLDYPWQKLSDTRTDLFWLPSLIFTFNNSGWDAVGDYTRYLQQNQYVKMNNLNQVNINWWSQPILSTWGEQTIQNVTDKNPKFNTGWVKDYVTKQMEIYPRTSFTIILEHQWQEILGDPKPAKRFTDLQELIKWCHQHGHKVVLLWKAWIAEDKSLAQEMAITDGDFVDATHPNFATYVKHCCAAMLSSADTALNADGLKIAAVFQVRNPLKANYKDSTRGIGLEEAYSYLKTFYDQAKSIKSDALIMSFAPSPHFRNVQDMVCINEDLDDRLRREKRARIISKALPGILINGDASDMSSQLALYHYVTSSIYATPEIEYLTKFRDQAIDTVMKASLKGIIDLYQTKGKGTPEFQEYGWWQWKNNGRVVAESIAKGTALLYHKTDSKAVLFSTLSQDIPFMLEKKRLIQVEDDKGNEIPFETLSLDIYKLKGIQQNKFYSLKFRHVSSN